MIIISSIKRLIRKIRFKSESERVLEVFQLKEHDNQLWLTVNGGLVCPASMLKEEPVVAVNMMRVMYMDRLFGKEDKDE